jgi:hypothetical protein
MKIRAPFVRDWRCISDAFGKQQELVKLLGADGEQP